MVTFTGSHTGIEIEYWEQLEQWANELDIMEELGYKADIEAIYSLGGYAGLKDMVGYCMCTGTSYTIVPTDERINEPCASKCKESCPATIDTWRLLQSCANVCHSSASLPIFYEQERKTAKVLPSSRS
eukprot:1161397-Pelagomonas_calceolata.AAC.2